MKLDIVLLVWNDADITQACLQQIESWRPPQSRVWVVDNGSTPPFPQPSTSGTVIRNKENLGFSGGVNRALHQLDLSESGAVLLLNTDAVLTPVDASNLLDCFEAHPEIAAMSPLLCETDGNDQILYAGARNIGRYISTRCKTTMDARPASYALQPAQSLSGTAFLCRTAVFQTIGFLDERFFFSGEIADLCQRMSSAGLPCAVCTAAQIVHDLSQKQHQRSAVHVYYALRNRFLFVRIHEPIGTRLLLTGFWMAVGIAMVLQSALKRNRIKTKSAWRAILDGLSGRFGNRNACLPL